jgi:hypothetical protein
LVFLCFFSYNQRFFCMNLSLGTNLVLNWPVLSFPERFQPIAAAAMCTVIINVLEVMHLMVSLSISDLYLIEFHDFADSIQERMKHQIGGCNSGPTGHDFLDNSNIYFLFFIVRTGPFSKCENRSDSQIGCQARTWAVLTFNMVLLKADIFGSHWPVRIENRAENRRRFSANRWEPPNTREHLGKKLSHRISALRNFLSVFGGCT